MARPPLVEPLLELADAWRSATAPSRRQIAATAVGLVCVAALLVARQGTARARLGAAAAMALSTLAAVAWRLIERRRLRQPERIVRGLAAAVDRERAGRALRALSLVGPDLRRDGTSTDLARLHVTRALADLPGKRIVERASRQARWVTGGALAVGACVLGLMLTQAWAVLEGADVLASRRGVAPAAMRWLDEVDVVARPPEYLHEPEQPLVSLSSPLLLPYGTTLTVRGAALHPGRRLLLSDGAAEVPFVEDGAGALVARWQVTRSTRLRVVARFGPVVIGGPEELRIQSLPDQVPVVMLEGAPRTVKLADQTGDIEIKYEASDDHGLREVHLVLRSGTREERRVLTRLDGETTMDKGGERLALRDPFLRKSHVPVAVTVEAEDNDPLTGPKWGASAAITLLPPDVGEPEARRLDALRALRDALVDTLAWRLAHDAPASTAARASFLAAEREKRTGGEQRLKETLARSYAGVHVPGRLRALLIAQEQKTGKVLDAEALSATSATHARVVKATERYVLVLDAVVRGLGRRDARGSARQLADVADDLALGVSQMQDEAPEARLRGAARADAAMVVLAGGARALVRLGALGRDLGEIVEADQLRVRRARDDGDLAHAEWAARDLAARLRQPDPSFGSQGGAGRAGGEAGGARGTPGEEGANSGDEVDQAQAEAEEDLERLAQDHAGQIGQVQQALAAATSEDEAKELRAQAERHAQAIRQAVRQLPSVGMGSDSWTSKGAAARELAEQMAQSLEQGQADEAVQSGRGALGALDEARRMLQKGSWVDDPAGADPGHLDGVRRTLESEERWAEDQRQAMRRRAEERARGALEQGGQDEGKLADRARDLAGRSRDRGSLPDGAVEAIEDAERAARSAAQALKQGDADRGLEQQRDAQRALEAARQALQGDDDSSGNGDGDSGQGRRDGEGRQGSRDARVDIPGAGAHKGPEDFRRRVVRGLGQPASGSLKEAIHRYAEGLLR